MLTTYRSQKCFWEDLRSGKIEQMIRETAPSHTVNTSAEVFNVMRPIFANELDVEKMYGIFLNSKNEILSIDLLASGSISSSSIYPREMIKKVLKHHAASMILCHNHPSGDPKPSGADCGMTQSIMLAVFAIGVAFFDHIIVGNGKHFSFGDSGLIEQYRYKISGLCERMHINGLLNKS